MNILLINGFFAPHSCIASVRPTKLAKYLLRQGHDVTVLTKRQNLDSLPADAVMARDLGNIGADRVHYMEPCSLEKWYWRRSGRLPSRTGGTGRLLDKLCLVALEMLSFHTARRKTAAWLRPQTFDCVVSTYGPYYPHKLAAGYKKKHPACTWVAEYRDQPEWRAGLLAALSRRSIRQVLCEADSAVVVSRGQQQYFAALADRPEDILVLRNGFDREDLGELKAPQPHDALRLLYAGTLYPGKSDLRPIFRALSELSEEHGFGLDRVELRYYGKDTNQMEEMLRETPALRSRTRMMGFVPRDASLAAQQESDILLLASWNTEKEQGIMTGKVYEYMMSGKPILATISGEVPDSELKEILHAAGQDGVWEEARDRKDYLHLKERLWDHIQDFLRMGYVPVLSREAAADYQYDNIAASLAVLGQGRTATQKESV